ncbi:MAG: hypothetical protein JOZ39_10470 [Chloroflexi bacterium]|nr:hypothetical protein [Chloroflexota bacterium]
MVLVVAAIGALIVLLTIVIDRNAWRVGLAGGSALSALLLLEIAGIRWAGLAT